MTCSRYALIVGILIAALAAPAWGDYAYVGGGDKFAKVLVEFDDGAIYAFGVSFSDPSTTGVGLMDLIEAGTTLTTQREYYPAYGWIIEGISYMGHTSIDDYYGPNPNAWWRYWVMDPPDGWEMPWDYGASGRTAADGCADAWVYGHNTAPRLPGDANNDLAVNGGDLALVGGNWFQTGKTWSEGDFNGDGAVDGGDLALMGGNWMFGSPPSPAPLPEPGAAVLLVAAVPWLGRRRAG
ncbi:MAG: hypothetical protein MUP47_07660 [Phycisphaerae bacterium]|nr:hypothetical protein [Phycisphaerae bacterium]